MFPFPVKLCCLCFVFQMLTGEPIATCLSPSVHDMICKLGFEVQEHCAVSSVVSDKGEVHWEAVTKCVKCVETGW